MNKIKLGLCISCVILTFIYFIISIINNKIDFWILATLLWQIAYVIEDMNNENSN